MNIPQLGLHRSSSGNVGAMGYSNMLGMNPYGNMSIQQQMQHLQQIQQMQQMQITDATDATDATDELGQ